MIEWIVDIWVIFRLVGCRTYDRTTIDNVTVLDSCR